MMWKFTATTPLCRRLCSKVATPSIPLSVIAVPNSWSGALFPKVRVEMAYPLKTFERSPSGPEFPIVPDQLGVFVTRTPGRSEVENISNIHSMGVLATVHRYEQRGDQILISMSGDCRIRCLGALPSKTPGFGQLSVQYTHVNDNPFNEEGHNNVLLREAIRQTLEKMDAVIKSGYLRENITFLLNKFSQVPSSSLSDMLCGALCLQADIAQQLIEEVDVEKRLIRVRAILQQTMLLATLQEEIEGLTENDDVLSSAMRRQKRSKLVELRKRVNKELGIESDEKDSLTSKFEERFEKLNLSDNVMQIATEEMAKLTGLDPSSTEFNVSRNYLDWLSQLPWGVSSEDNLDPKRASETLEKDHYGMEDVKKRIAEFIAVGNLNGKIKGKILCFAGPPGVGKTSIGKSVAEAIGREFYRVSVGGLVDVSEIKGHRRTYVGSMPGKIIQALKACKTSNPVILIDEIDKLGRSHNGDPASALLEALDPSQNSEFLDHYLDIAFDLSQVLFLTTANYLENVPKPLLDRMEVIEVSGYVADEKLCIAKRYLLNRAMEECGLKESNLTISDDAIAKIIEMYCREPGVRNLQRFIERICRQVALKTALAPEGISEYFVTDKNLEEYVGKPVFSSSPYYGSSLPTGVVMGLAYSQLGGDALYIESIVVGRNDTSKASLKTTGQLGDVMEESSSIAWSYAKSLLRKMDAGNDFFDKSEVHMHVPDGAIKKDGPSAGITIVSALLSGALNTPARGDIAMTGEVTLNGLVLAIGGVKEKCMAAKRAGVYNIILPHANQNSFEELPEIVRKGITPYYAKTYDDVFKIVFPTAGGSIVDAVVERVD